ncbi:hypothetical protein ACHAPE_007573 [Trichoderma viride]
MGPPVPGAKLAQGSLPGGLWRRIAPGAWGAQAGRHWPGARSCADCSYASRSPQGLFGDPLGLLELLGHAWSLPSTKNHYKQQLGGWSPPSPTNHHKGWK